eukprot:gene18035-21479_t
MAEAIMAAAKNEALKSEIRAHKEPVKGILQTLCIRIATSKQFDNFIILLILLNCASLAAYDPIQEGGAWNETLSLIELAFNACFTVEIIIRVTSLGSLLQHLRDAWNFFDFVIVVMGYSSLLGTSSGVNGLRALRALRALRPLRTVSRVPSLRAIADSFVNAVPLLLSVMSILFFYHVLFAIAGLNLFMKALHNRCVDSSGVPNDDDSFGCGGAHTCTAEGSFCGDEDDLADGHGILPPGIPAFDNFLKSILTVFVGTTLEGWPTMMYRTMDSTSTASILYYFGLVLSGPFFIVNLFLAVLYFVLWVIIGNYICLTLFLAVVMEAFEGEIDSNDTFSKKKTAPSDAWSVKVKTSMRQMTRKVSTIGRVASRMSKVYDKVAEQKIVKTSSGYLIVPLSPDPMKFQISDSEAIHMDEISMHHVLSRGRQPVPQPEGTPPGAVPEEPPFLEMARTPPSDAVDLGLLTQTPDSLEPLADLQSELALGLDASLQSEGDALEEAAKLAPLSPPDSPSPRSQSPRTSRSRLPSSLASLALPDDEHAPGPEGKSLAQPVGESAHGAPRIVDLRTCSGLEGLSHLHRDSDMDLEMLPEELEGRRELEALGLPGTPGRCARVDQPGGPVASSAAEALDGPGALGRKVSLPEGRPPGAATGPQAVCEAFDPQIQVVEADIQAHDRESILRSPSMLRSDSNPMHPDKLAEEVKPRMAMFNTANDEHPAVRLMRAQLLSMVNSRSFDYFMFVCVILSCVQVLKIKFSESAGMEEEKTDTEPKDVEGEIGIQALTSPASQNVSTTDEQPKLCLRSRLCQPFVWLRKLLSSWCGERSGPRPKYLQLCLRLVESNAFNRFFWGVILVNTLCLAVEYHGMPESMQNFLSVMNVYLTMLFTLELVLKIAGLGLSTFLEDYFNIFDFLIVAISMVEINVEGGIKGLSALRCFRVLRIFKVFKYAPSLTQIVGVLLSSLASFLSIGLLLFLFLGVFSIIGLHVYGDVLEEDQRPNFRNIGQAFILVFQVLTLENWNELMLDVVDRTDWSAMAFERPTMEDDSKEGKIWTLVDLVTMSIFTLEMVLKVAIFGLWKDNARQKAYLSSSWNRLDMTIVFSSLLLFGLEQGTSIPELGLVRLLRALRPLRIISRSAGIQLVVNSLMHSVFSITNVFLLCVLFFFIFGILGVQLFAGKFHKCQIGGEPTDMGYEDFGTTSFSQLEKVVAALDRDECTCSYCSWENAFLHFDNIGIAMLSLFVVSALDGWAEVLHDAMDATEVDKAPKRDNFPGAFMFLAVFICIVAFALLNLFIGVVHFQFSRIKMLKQTNDVILTEDQKHWTLIVYTLSRLSAPVLVEAPSGTGLVAKSRQYVFRMVVHPMFDNLMMLCILLNTLSMACTHYRESAVWTQILNYGNYFFVTIFTAEAGCKIIGLGPKQYWKDGWNRFDFVIVMGSLLDLMVAVLNASFLRIFRVGRISRISRVMRLTRSLNGVQSLMKTLVQSLSAFQTVGSLLLLVFFMYSYAGVLLFGRIKHGDNINDHANFESFDFASITLLRVATGEAWAGILEDSWKNGCKDGDSNNKGCGGIVAIPFYLSFLLAVSMILLQLFTAIIIQNFEDRDSKDRWPITEEMMESFSQLWEENAQGEYLSVKGLRRMMDTMPEPIGLISEKHYLDHPPIGVSHGANVLHLVSNVDVKLSPYGMRFHSTLYALCTRVAEQELPYGDLRRGHQAMVANMKSSTGPYIAKSKDPQDDSDLSYFRTFSEAEQRQIGLVHVM